MNIHFPSYGAVVVPDYPIQVLSLAHAYTKTIEIFLVNVLCPFLSYLFTSEEKVSDEARGRWKYFIGQYRTYTTFGFGVEGFTD